VGGCGGERYVDPREFPPPPSSGIFGDTSRQMFVVSNVADATKLMFVTFLAPGGF